MKRVFLSLALLATVLAAPAQLVDTMSDKVSHARVALVDEFIKRFNHELPSPETPDVAEEDRAAADIIMLFNGARFTSEGDSAMTLAMEFARAAVASDIKLSFNDSTWYARATCHGTYRKEPVEFNLLLRVEHRGDDIYRWVPFGVEGSLFSLPPKDTGDGFMIFPDDHETNFMSLKDMTATQTESILLYAPEGTRPDPLSVFMTMVYGGQFKIDYVSPLEFIFRQIPGWEFTVRFFDREELNSGWLIDSIERK